MVAADWPDVARIYGQGIETAMPHSDECPGMAEWDVGIRGRDRGWAASFGVGASRVHGRGRAQHLRRRGGRGQRVGSELPGPDHLSEDLGSDTSNGYLPRECLSIRLHVTHGFRVIGIRERIGQHHGRWRDTVLMERRSSRVGL
jgi:phosphinothricin acetyltransferase